jgi:hypothetical protein
VIAIGRCCFCCCCCCCCCCCFLFVLLLRNARILLVLLLVTITWSGFTVCRVNRIVLCAALRIAAPHTYVQGLVHLPSQAVARGIQ